MPTLKESLQVLNFFRSVAESKERKAAAGDAAQKKAAWEQTKFLIEQQRKRREFSMTKMSSYMKGLPEGPSKELARSRLTGYFNSLPKYEKEVLAPYFQRLIPPEEEKAMEFVKIMGPEPSLEGIDSTKEPERYGSQLLDKLSYRWKYQKAQGIDPGAFPESAPVNEKVYAYREQGSFVTKLIDMEEERWTEIGKSLPGSPTATALAASNFQWPMRTKVMELGPDSYEVTTMKNFLPGTSYGLEYSKRRKIFSDEAMGMQEMPPLAVGFGSYLDADEDEQKKTPEGRLARDFLGMTEGMKDPAEIDGVLNLVLGSKTPGWNYRFIPKKIKTSYWWDHMGGVIVGCPGKEVYLPGKDDTVVLAYHDESTGWYYTQMMQGLRRDEMMAWAARQIGERPRE